MKFLFYIAKQYSIPIIQPLVSLLEKRQASFALFVSEKVSQQLPPSWKKYTILRNVPEAVTFNPDFALSPGNFIDFRIPGIKVQIFHGLGVEKESHYKIRHFFDVYLTSGPFVTQRFQKLEQKYNSFIVRETGWPKVDYILNYPASGLREKYGISANKKIILYAPTFSRKMESASDLLPQIPATMKKNEVWIVKFHELMSSDIMRSIQDIAGDQLRVINTFDITPLLHLADCLVSDTSSVLYEFLALNKPVITYRTQGRPEKGINIQSPSELRNALDQALGQGVTALNYNCLMQVNPYLNGEISTNVFRTLTEIKQNNLLAGKRKRRNTFRKLQILYHEKFKKGYLR